MNLKSKGLLVLYCSLKRRRVMNFALSLFVLISLLVISTENVLGNTSDLKSGKERVNRNELSQTNRTSNMIEAPLMIGQEPGKMELKGNVFDESGIPVPGATVVVKGTTIGTVTDNDGRFSLVVPDNVKSVLVSFVGYISREVRIVSGATLKITLEQQTIGLDEVVAIGYGTQKKETLTGAISSVQTEKLLNSPNASVANALAGQITGLSSVQYSGQPGKEDPTIFIRGVGSLTEGSSSPLILVDGVENSFYQMDPNEIASISVLKDASATAVFGVRGANGVILVTTRRGNEGKAKISVNSSMGIQQPTRILDLTDSYTFAKTIRRIDERDGKSPDQYSFTDFDIERFRLGDDPLLYPDIDWRDYLMKNQSVQTQHNVNISGGTERVKYFASVGFLFQDGLFKRYGDLGYDNNFNYNRFNYRTNLDIDVTKSTLLQIGIGGIVGNRKEPNGLDWQVLNWTQPMSTPGVIDGILYLVDVERYPNILMRNNVMNTYYGAGYIRDVNNKMNLDAVLKQRLDFVTKGLSFEVKGAYNTSYTNRKNVTGELERYVVFYKSELDGSGLKPGDEGFDYTHVYKINGSNEPLKYTNSLLDRDRDWYFETSFRYNRKFGNHNVGALLLYNQSKTYYPQQFTQIPSGYIGLVGRLTYDYRSKYIAEFNIGRNGSENFAPGKRYGIFPAGSVGYVLTEESFMKKQKTISYLKLRASVGLVGNDKLGGERFLYLPDGYETNLDGTANVFQHWVDGYNFGVNSNYYSLGVSEKKIGNPDVTWEKALKQNYGIDLNVLENRLKFSGDIFREYRRDILITPNTFPGLTGIASLVPAVNKGKVKNRGYELEIKWEDKLNKGLRYHIDANMSYSKNEIVEMDEIPQPYEYLQRTGHEVGAVFGYEFDRLFTEDDFNITSDGSGNVVYSLKDGIPDHKNSYLRPGDAKYIDLNGDEVIDAYDQHRIGTSQRPDYTFGLNYGLEYKGFFADMNWTGISGRTLVFEGEFKTMGVTRNMIRYIVDNSWWEETGGQTKLPRMSNLAAGNNTLNSSVWLRDGSYLKLKSASIGYNFRNDRLKKYGISNLGVKLTGYNLLTFDRFKIMDPESKPNGNDTYPVVKIYNLSLNVTF